MNRHELHIRNVELKERVLLLRKQVIDLTAERDAAREAIVTSLRVQADQRAELVRLRASATKPAEPVGYDLADGISVEGWSDGGRIYCVRDHVDEEVGRIDVHPFPAFPGVPRLHIEGWIGVPKPKGACDVHGCQECNL